MPELKEGDVVRLKNGTGPTMTIASLDNSAGEAICMWFEGKNRIEDIFDVVALQLVNKKADMKIHPRGRREKRCKVIPA